MGIRRIWDGDGRKGDSRPATDWAAIRSWPRASTYFSHPRPNVSSYICHFHLSVMSVTGGGGGVSKPPPPSSTIILKYYSTSGASAFVKYVLDALREIRPPHGIEILPQQIEKSPHQIEILPHEIEILKSASLCIL